MTRRQTLAPPRHFRLSVRGSAIFGRGCCTKPPVGLSGARDPQVAVLHGAASFPPEAHFRLSVPGSAVR